MCVYVCLYVSVRMCTHTMVRASVRILFGILKLQLRKDMNLSLLSDKSNAPYFSSPIYSMVGYIMFMVKVFYMNTSKCVFFCSFWCIYIMIFKCSRKNARTGALIYCFLDSGSNSEIFQ